MLTRIALLAILSLAAEPGLDWKAVARAYEAGRFEAASALVDRALEQEESRARRQQALEVVAILDARFERWVDCRLRVERLVRETWKPNEIPAFGREIVLRRLAEVALFRVGADETDRRITRTFLEWCEGVASEEERVAVADLLAIARADHLALGIRGFFVDRTYGGQYGGDPRLVAAMDEVEAALPRARDRLFRRLADSSTPLPPIVVRFEDGRPGRGTIAMAAAKYGPKDGPTGVVAVTTQTIVSGIVDVERTLTHELTHALHQPAKNGEESPTWLKEGLARWVESIGWEDFDDLVLATAIEATGTPGRPLSLLLASPELLPEEGPDRQGIVGATILFYVEHRCGLAATRRLVVAILEGAPWREAFRKETGVEVEALFSAARDWYLARVRERFPWAARFAGPDRNEIPEDEAARRLSELDAILFSEEPVPGRSWLMYLRGGLLFRAGKSEERAEAFRAFLTAHPHHPLARWARVSELRILSELRRDEAVVALAPDVRRDFAWDDEPLARRIDEAVAAAKARLAEKEPAEGK